MVEAQPGLHSEAAGVQSRGTHRSAGFVFYGTERVVDAQQRKNAVAWRSVISNTLLAVGKLTIGMLIGAVSVISEAAHKLLAPEPIEAVG